MSPFQRHNIAILRSRRGARWKIGDFVVGLTAFSIAFMLTPHKLQMPQPYYIFIVGSMYAAMLVTFSLFSGVPNPEQRRSSYELFALSALAVTLTYVFFSVVVGLVLVRAYGRYIVLVTTGFSLIGIIFPRLLLGKILRLQPINVVIYGAGEKGENLLRRLADDPHFQVLGFLDNNSLYHGTKRFDLPVFGSIQTFGAEKLLEINAEVVVISVAGSSLLNQNAHAILELPLDGIEVLNQGAFLEYHFKEVSVEYGCPQWFASTPSVPGNPSIFAAKRLMDIGAGLAGFFLSLPAWPFIALAIKLDSPGPAFFRQTRVGFRGKHFTILKFRTMRTDAEKDGPMWATKNDPRVTRVGQLLRVTRLDELPQFLNIIKGDMALVGPRPERPEFVKELTAEIPFYDHRHLVPPGLTGWAQVRYRYGASKEDAVKKLQYELYYVRHLSLLFDIEVLLRTIPLVAKGSR